MKMQIQSMENVYVHLDNILMEMGFVILAKLLDVQNVSMVKVRFVKNVLINHGPILQMANVSAIIQVMKSLIIQVFVIIVLWKDVLHVPIIKQNVIDVKIVKLISMMGNVFVEEMRL